MDLINFGLKQKITGPKLKIYKELFCDIVPSHFIYFFPIFINIVVLNLM